MPCRALISFAPLLDQIECHGRLWGWMRQGDDPLFPGGLGISRVGVLRTLSRGQVSSAFTSLPLGHFPSGLRRWPSAPRRTGLFSARFSVSGPGFQCSVSGLG